MGESTATYSSASSRRAAICAAGRTRNIVEVWDAMCGRGRAVVLEGTVYGVGSGHLAVADSGDCIAIGEYSGGLELWNWRSRRLIWRNPQVRRVESVAFASNDKELIVGTDAGTAVLATADGTVIAPRLRIKDVVASPFAPLLFGIQRSNLVVLRRDTGAVLTCGPRRSFGVLAAAFTPGAVMMSETDGSLRAFDLSNGEVIAEACGWYVALAPVVDQARITGWSNVRGEAWGELIQLDLSNGISRHIVRKEWQSALPILSGTAWVFSDGTIASVQ